jgi:hypothetical protein
LIGGAILDDDLESPRLQLHLHQERPIGVIYLGEGRVATPTANLMNHPLDHNSIFGGVIVTRSLSSRHLHNKNWNIALIPLVRISPKKQPSGQIGAKKIHTTHVNTMKLISFWCSKLDFVF